MVQDIWLKKTLNLSSSNPQTKPKNKRNIFNEHVVVEWIKRPNSVSGKNVKYYKFAKVGNVYINQGDSIMIPPEEKGDPPQIAYVSYMFEDENKEKMCHAHFYCRGTDTIMGDKSDPRELFLVDHCEDVRLSTVLSKANVHQISFSENWNTLGGTEKAQLNDLDDGKHYFFSKRYDYNKSQFVDFVDNKSRCISCFWQEEEEKFNTPTYTEVYMGDSYIQWQQEKYYIGSGIFLESGDYMPREYKTNKEDNFYTLNELDGEYVRLSKSDREIFYPEKYRKSESTLEEATLVYPHTIGIIERFKKVKANVHVKIRILYRFEDVHVGVTGDPYLLYWTNEFYSIKSWTELKTLLKGKCYISNKVYVQNAYQWIKEGPYRFYFEKFFDHKNKKILPSLPKEAKNIGLPRNLDFLTKPTEWPELQHRLKSMDIYAGCGGLSDGLERSGLVETKWAIEIDSDAAASFQLNHPLANIVDGDCNKVLNMIINNKHQHLNFPERGEVDIIVGGPPCQGFSVLNRCSQGKTSKANNSQIKTYLGFIEYYRPRYFIYENVQNFVSFDCNYHLKSTLKCILAIGYQVSFGVLQAGNYGLPQARRRFFIIGAAPGLKLPNLPEPSHCFVKKAPSIKVDNLIYDTGERITGYLGSLPYRAVTVRDAIADFPLVNYENMKEELPYTKKPIEISFYAKYLREYANKADIVTLHECKPTSDLVKKRIEYVPPNGDWRDLPNINVKIDKHTKTDLLPYVYRTKNQSPGTVPRGICPCNEITEDVECPNKGKRHPPLTLIPWSVAHSADKNNNWRGVYGRLQWDGYFGTVTTEPEPSRTQGKVLHPDQNRVVTVRECARAQGFHDEFQFAGTTSKIYRQIGNAVPPILAMAIGREIIKTLVP